MKCLWSWLKCFLAAAFAAAGAVSCLQDPESRLLRPEVISVEESADWHSVMLSAVLDHAGNVKVAGFYLWQDEGEKIKTEGRIEGTALSARVDGLEAETTYQFSVFISNGREEDVSKTYSFVTEEYPMPEILSTSVEPTYCNAVVSVQFSGMEHLRSCSVLYGMADSGQRTVVSLKPDGNGYSCTLEGLKAETEYSYSISYSNGQRTRESQPVLFRTPEAPKPEPEPEPEPDPNPDPHPLPPNAFDPALLDYLLGHFDEDSNGVLTDVELSKVHELDISDILLESHAGLEFLPALETLISGDNWLARFDLRANIHLKSFSGGRSAHLQEIILDNPELLQTYIVSAPNLRGLVFTGCPRLYVCQWYDVGLESVDLSQNQDLYRLDFNGTKLKELDLSACIRLKILKSENNPDLKTIWLKKGIILDSCEVDAHTEIKYK